MSSKLRMIALCLTAVASIFYVRDAHALWPIRYSWSCLASSSTQVQCDFTVTNPGPSGYEYKWLFGDGASTGRSTSTTTTHYYAVSAGQSGAFNVSLLGYASSTSGLDNVIECSVSFGNDWGVGGGPVYTGNCQ